MYRKIHDKSVPNVASVVPGMFVTILFKHLQEKKTFTRINFFIFLLKSLGKSPCCDGRDFDQNNSSSYKISRETKNKNIIRVENSNEIHIEYWPKMKRQTKMIVPMQVLF